MGYEGPGGVKSASSVLPLGRLVGVLLHSVILGHIVFEELLGCAQGDVEEGIGF